MGHSIPSAAPLQRPGHCQKEPILAFDLLSHCSPVSSIALNSGY